MTEKIVFTPEFFVQNIRGTADLARINDLVAIRPPGRTVIKEIMNIFSDLPRQEVKDGVVDTKDEWMEIKLQQSIDRILEPWLKTPNLGGTPMPALTALELARESGLSATKVIELVNDRCIVVSSGNKEYRTKCDTAIFPTQKRIVIDSTRINETGQLVPCEIKVVKPIRYTISEFRKANEILGSETKINSKKVIKGARYESRPPGGGPVQRARFQEQKVTGQVVKAAQERAKIVFELVNQSATDVEPLKRINKTKEAINPAIAKVVDWFKQNGGKKWLRGVSENELAKSLLDLTKGQTTDVLFWNCFDFDWKQNRPGEYPACIIGDDVDESIVMYHYSRLQNAIEYLSLLGPIMPIALIPTNEINAPVWKYVQTLDERETIVSSTVAKLQQKLDRVSRGSPIKVMRWDDYLISRGVETEANSYSLAGADVIGTKLPEYRRIRMIADDQAYFRQFEIKVSRSEAEKRISYYYGVYIGEGKAFAEIVKLGQKILVLDLEEFRVGEMTEAGAEGIVPIVSPLSIKEKLDYYRWKKDMISRK